MQEWVDSRRALYLRLKKMVETHLGSSIRRTSYYERQFQREFAGKWKASSKQALLNKVLASDIVFLADFHSLKQSQKAHVRILNNLAGKVGVIAVEFFESQHQKYLDKYLSGKISEKEFLKSIQWHRRWGFPWENYRPIVDWAKQNSVQIVGLNLFLKDHNQAALHLRDQHASEILGMHLKQKASPLLVCIFGEQHFAESHLPRELLRQVPHHRSVVVFQNHEDIYFQMMKKNLDHDIDVIRLSDRKFLVQNVPPWVKWQDYLLFLEKSSDMALNKDPELEFTEDVYEHIKILAKDIHVQPPRPDFVVYTAQDQKFWSWIQKQLRQSERRWVKSLIESSVSFYLPEHRVAYLARLSVNHSAMLAMSILHSEICNQRKLHIHFPEDFLILIWQEAIRYFGSKLLNPRRKTDTLLDIKSTLVSEKYSLSNEALRLALSQKMVEHVFLSTGRKPRQSVQASRLSSYRLAARLLGGMMGEKFYSGFRSHRNHANVLLKWVKEPLDSDRFEGFYYEALEVLESWPESFRSKKERL